MNKLPLTYLLFGLSCAEIPPKTTPVPPLAQRLSRHAIVFGAEADSPGTTGAVLGADADLDSVSSTLREAGWFVTELRGALATEVNLRHALDGISRRSAASSVLVYVSGHGALLPGDAGAEPASVLLPPGVPQSLAADYGIRVDDLLIAMDALQVDGAALVTDACHIGSRGPPGKTALISAAGPQDLSAGSNRGGDFTRCWLDRGWQAGDQTGDGVLSLLETVPDTFACPALSSAAYLRLGPDFADMPLKDVARSAPAALIVPDLGVSPMSLGEGQLFSAGHVYSVPLGALDLRQPAQGVRLRVTTRSSDLVQVRRLPYGDLQARVVGPRSTIRFERTVWYTPEPRCGFTLGVEITDLGGAAQPDLLVFTQRCAPTVVVRGQPDRSLPIAPLAKGLIVDLNDDGRADLVGLTVHGEVMGWTDVFVEPRPLGDLGRATQIRRVGSRIFLLSGDEVVAVDSSGRGASLPTSSTGELVDLQSLGDARWLAQSAGEPALLPLRARGVGATGHTIPVDIDSDGLQDLLFLNEGISGIRAFKQINASPGWFMPMVLNHPALSSRAIRVVPLDADADALFDLFVPTAGSWSGLPAWSLLRQDDLGRFDDLAESADLAYTDNVEDVHVADLDGDLDPDLVVALRRGPILRFTNQTTGTSWTRVELQGDVLGATVQSIGLQRDPQLQIGVEQLVGQGWARTAVIALPTPGQTSPLGVRVVWPDGSHSVTRTDQAQVLVRQDQQRSVEILVGHHRLDLTSGAHDLHTDGEGDLTWWAGDRGWRGSANSGELIDAAQPSRTTLTPGSCGWASVTPVGVMAGCEPRSAPAAIVLDGSPVLPDLAPSLFRQASAVGDHLWITTNGDRTIRAFTLPDLKPASDMDLPAQSSSRREWIAALPHQRLAAVGNEDPPFVEVWDVSQAPRLVETYRRGVGTHPAHPAVDGQDLWYLTRFAVEKLNLNTGRVQRTALPSDGQALLLLPEYRIGVVQIDLDPARVVTFDLDSGAVLDQLSLPQVGFSRGLARLEPSR